MKLVKTFTVTGTPNAPKPIPIYGSELIPPKYAERAEKWLKFLRTIERRRRMKIV